MKIPQSIEQSDDEKFWTNAEEETTCINDKITKGNHLEEKYVVEIHRVVIDVISFCTKITGLYVILVNSLWNGARNFLRANEMNSSYDKTSKGNTVEFAKMLLQLISPL
jgi:hypothetical protein